MNYDSPEAVYGSPGAFYDSGPATGVKKKMANIKLDLKNLSVLELINKGETIGTAMTGNATFSTLATQVTAFNGAVALLATKNNNHKLAQQTADGLLTERDDQVALVEAAFSQLASAAEGVTKDGALLQSGGWTLRGAPAPVGPLPAPQNLTVTGGDLDGTNDCHWDPVRGADTYLGECGESATGPFTQKYAGKKSSCTISGLTSGALCYFRVRAVGAAGPGPWSDIAAKRAT